MKAAVLRSELEAAEMRITGRTPVSDIVRRFKAEALPTVEVSFGSIDEQRKRDLESKAKRRAPYVVSDENLRSVSQILTIASQTLRLYRAGDRDAAERIRGQLRTAQTMIDTELFRTLTDAA